MAYGQYGSGNKKLESWVNYYYAKEGEVGPAYCKACKKKRKSKEKCKDCPQPEVYPQNVPIIDAYLMVSSQWRLGPSGIPYGLDYSSIEAALRMAGTEIDPEIFHGIRTIEQLIIEKLSPNTESE